MRKGILKSVFENTYLFLIFLFLYLPIVLLMMFSFNDAKSVTRWNGFSLRWYEEMLTNQSLLQAFANTLSIGIIAAVVSCIIGTAASIGIQGYRSKKIRGIINAVTNLPMVSSELVMGVSLMMLFSTANIQRGYLTMLISHITFCIPYVIVSVLPKLMQLDTGLYEAALDLGAKPLYAFRKVIIPEIRPGIVNGLLISFTLSLDDFVISNFTSGYGVQNLSMFIYSGRTGPNPMYNALSTVMFISVAVLIFFINRRSGRKSNEPISFFG